MKLGKDERGISRPRQLIVMGAPGTGKSHWVQDVCHQSDIPKSQIYRITFHPELSYGDFVGVYKPAPVYVTTGDRLVFDDKMRPLKKEILDGEQNERRNVLPIVRYEYRCGPFIDAYANAMRNPDKDFVLVIEEINRASPAVVFGDILQLLDRNENHESQYPIRTPADLVLTLAEQRVPNPDFLALPANLYIWGTMNRADESVSYVDSAFVRRWDTVYLPYNIPSTYDDETVACPELLTWKQFRGRINDALSRLKNVEDDKFLGPYFLKRHELDDDRRVFSKLITYLWHDVVPMERDKIFIEGSLSELYGKWMKGEEIFAIDA
jgi:5-methylcytosine-specific restriction protein B